MTFDVITIGRIGVDVYPLQTGVSLRQVESVRKFLGGSPTNVAVAASRYGRSAAVITRTGEDPFGEYLHDALRGFGVDDRYVTAVAGLPTPVTFCEIFPPDDFPLYFYRQPKAPDLVIHSHELDLDAIRAAKLFWVTGTGLSQEPSRSATLAALEARAGAGPTVFDLDYRPMFWNSREEAREQYARALPSATVAVGNLDEWDTAVGTRDPRTAAATGGLELAVDVVNGLGAGDAFGGALCHGLLAGWDLARLMRFCNAAGALVASRLACADAMPDESEVLTLIEETAHVR